MSLSAFPNPLDPSTYLIFYLDSNNNVALTTSDAAKPTKIAKSNQINVNDDTSVAPGNMVATSSIVALYLNNLVNVYGFYNGTPATTSCSSGGPNALVQIVPGFLKFVSDDNLSPAAQLAGCTNNDNTDGVLFYVTVGGNLNYFNLLDQEPELIASNVAMTTYLTAAWGSLGTNPAAPHVAYQTKTPGKKSVYDIIIYNATDRSSVQIAADSMFPSPLSITFTGTKMHVFYFNAAQELKRATFSSYSDTNPSVVTHSDATNMDTATQMTAVPNQKTGGATLYYIGENKTLVAYEDDLKG